MYKQTVTQIQGINNEDFFQKLENVFEQKLKEYAKQLQPEPQQEQTLLTRKEAAKFLGVSLVTINNWANKGVIRPKKIGNLVRYDLSELKQAFR